MMNDYGDYIFIFNYLEKEGINIDSKEFLFQLKTHPDFPSLYAFSDTLKFFKIDNIAARIESEDIDYLPEMFVALLQEGGQSSFFSFIEKSDNRYIYYKENNKVSLDELEFLDIWQNIVLVVEENEDKEIQKAKTKVPIKQAGLLLVVLIVFMISRRLGFSLLFNILIILGLGGIYLSIEAIRQLFGGNSSFANAVCNSASSVKSNCHTVITSKEAISFFGLGLSDLSIVFFCGQMLSFFLMAIGGVLEYCSFYLLSILAVSTPVIVYSIYYQKFIEKKWCAICLMIISVIILEALVLSAVLKNQNQRFFHPDQLLLFVSGFIISLLVWTILKPLLKILFELDESNTKLFRFKRNYLLFKAALQMSKKYDYETLESPIRIGSPDANIKLSLVTNPFCGYCVKSHELIKILMIKYPKDILVNLRFNLDFGNADDQTKALHFTLIEIYNKEGQDAFMDALGDWFEKKDLNVFFERYGKRNLADGKTVSFLNEMYQQNERNGLLYTPAIIVNNRLFPEMYNREDLVYFIHELIDDEELMLNTNTHLKKINECNEV